MDVLAPIPICPRYFKELKKVLKTQQLRCIARKNRKIYNYVSLNAGMKEFDLSIYDTLKVQEMHNLSLPSWTKAVYPTKLRQIAMYTMFILPGITKDLQKYSIGRLLGDMVLHMTQKRHQKLHPDRILFLYSAHEFTVANLLHSLGVWEVQDPPYCAAVLVELRLHNKNNFFVTVGSQHLAGRSTPGIEGIGESDKSHNGNPFLSPMDPVEIQTSVSFVNGS
uniref:acid phosphatase n=1 Tax=Timema californicum TaxID=61474 RepID=A0A7R9P924_TIMCA|nr:unnamed protein product [Timema californicum]